MTSTDSSEWKSILIKKPVHDKLKKLCAVRNNTTPGRFITFLIEKEAEKEAVKVVETPAKDVVSEEAEKTVKETTEGTTNEEATS